MFLLFVIKKKSTLLFSYFFNIIFFYYNLFKLLFIHLYNNKIFIYFIIIYSLINITLFYLSNIIYRIYGTGRTNALIYFIII